MDFVKKNWQFRDIISETELNRMEDGIEEGITKAEQAEQTAQQADQTATQTANELAAHLAEIASPTQLGHVKIGANLTIDPDGTLSASSGMYAEGVIKGPTGNAIGAYTFADSVTYVSRITNRDDAAKTVTVVNTTGLSVGDQVVLKTNNSSNLPTATVTAISNNVVTLNTTSTLDTSVTHLIKLGGSNIRQTAEGFNTIASGTASHAEGNSTTASGTSSHAEGVSTIASGTASHAEGNSTTASGNNSHAEGVSTIASGTASHAEGNSTTASGNNSHAEGVSTIASGFSSHAEGYFTTTSGSYSHAEGSYTTASGTSSLAEGHYTIANVYASHAGGRYNKSMTGSPTSMVATDDAYVIGNGTSDENRGNAFRVTFDGKVYGLSAFNSTGADYAEFFEWLDGNPENEDRVGYFVTLEGNKIRKATSADDYILGIVTANPSVVGDSHQDDWHGKYVRDVWGRIQYQWVDVPAEYDDQGNEVSPARQDYVPILNPDWNPDEEYIPREKRKEWAAVGIIGKLPVRDDGTCQVNGYCKPNDDGIATASSLGYRVMERVSANIIRIFVK